MVVLFLTAISLVSTATLIIGQNKLVVKKGKFSLSKKSVSRLSASNMTVESTVGQRTGNVKLQGGNYTVNSEEIKKSGVRAPAVNLERSHVYPNPCRVYKGQNHINFTRLTKNAEVSIYTISGELVIKFDKTDITTDEIKWDLKNESGNKIASGVYIFYIKYGDMTKKGKLAIIK
ncbi:T9SS type A sorting domain-containing protein [bacterium]